MSTWPTWKTQHLVSYISHNSSGMSSTAGGSFEAEWMKPLTFFPRHSCLFRPISVKSLKTSLIVTCSTNKGELGLEINVTFCVAATNIWLNLPAVPPEAAGLSRRLELQNKAAVVLSCTPFPARLAGIVFFFFLYCVFVDLRLRKAYLLVIVPQRKRRVSRVFFWQDVTYTGSVCMGSCFSTAFSFQNLQTCRIKHQHVRWRFAGMRPLTRLCKAPNNWETVWRPDHAKLAEKKISIFTLNRGKLRRLQVKPARYVVL